MSATTAQFLSLLQQMGSDVTFHREDAGTPCPCISPEGFRSLAWHKAHNTSPLCNEKGRLTSTILSVTVKAAVQPIRTSNRPILERAARMFGEIQTDDHFGIFPVVWAGTRLDFSEWSDAGEDYIVYDGRRFTCVSADKLPDVDGDPDHHWECGLRLLKPADERFVT